MESSTRLCDEVGDRNMTIEKKMKIDSIWRDTDVGEWVKLLAKEKFEDANKLYTKIAEKNPCLWFGWSVQKMCSDLSKEFNTEEEVEDYLKILEQEDYDLVGAVISYGVFDELYKLLKD